MKAANECGGNAFVESNGRVGFECSKSTITPERLRLDRLIAFGNRLLCPEGTVDNSLAFQRQGPANTKRKSRRDG